jgi:anti-sigma-K factor RskA
MTPDIHALVGAYVLDAVEPDERAAFEDHLAECTSCRAEVEALRSTAAALSTGVTAAPPPALRARVLAAAERTPQLPPTVERTPAAASTAPAHAKPRRRRPALWLAAAAAAVAIGAGGIVVDRLVDDDQPPPVTAADVFASADAEVRTIAISGGRARVAVSEDLGQMAVDGENLPPAGQGRVYQVWVVDAEGPTSAGLLDEPALALEIPDDAQVAVTNEPSGGSDQPTTEPLFSVDPADL